MKIFSSIRLSGCLRLEVAMMACFCLSTSALAQKYSRFQEYPSERKALVAKLSKQAADDKREARAWARAHGKPMRFERAGKLYELMALRNGEPVYYTTFNFHAAISTAADQVRNTAPYNLNGAGLSVGIWDEGSVRNTHQEFGNRVTLKDPETAFGDHGTHIAGTVGASGGFELEKTGMAPSVLMDSYDWDDDLSEMTGAAASEPGQNAKLYISNHSYGFTVNDSNLFGEYWSKPASLDGILYNSQYFLPFVAAGNEQDVADGFGTVSSYGVAKNTITIGAVYDAVSGVSRSLSQATMTSFSSWGPVNDGRIKPDIVANGYGVTSTMSSSDSAYSVKFGTSMATPNACGSAALLVEYYKDLFPGDAMRASSLKGLIIHTADDLGNTGPDYKFGWGLMNTLAAAELLKEFAGGAFIKLTEATVTTSQRTDEYSFQWNGIDPIRVTLCWTDPAGDADADTLPDLVNDLDLKMVSSGGVIHYPYKLNKSSPSALATTGENNVDNVEQIYIETPLAGTYTITVDFDESSLSGGAQWYSLLVTGDSGDSDSDGMSDSWESIYFGGPTNAVATGDLDGDGLDNYSEYIAGTLPNDAESVFKISSYSTAPDGGTPFVLHWTTMPGRLYTVGLSDNLIYSEFFAFPDATDLPYSVNSYTDTAERTEFQNFYRVDVRIDQ